MREDDDDAADHSSTAGDLADGLGETAEPGSSSIDPYGDESFDDTYGDEGLDDTYGDDTDGEDGSTTGADDSNDDSYDDGYGDDTYAGEVGDPTDPGDADGDDSHGDGTDGDGTYGDGDTSDDDTSDDDVVIEDETDAPDADGDDAGTGADADTSAVDTDPADIGPEAADPLEGVGFLLDELRDALFGEDDGSAAVAEPDLGPDVAEVASDTDLDLTGDGLVDGADLHEAASPFDFGVDEGGHHDPS
jgi:serine-type D-Ala-D-Ala carboxypeptidase (penicillin-binding protein 5/6)